MSYRGPDSFASARRRGRCSVGAGFTAAAFIVAAGASEASSTAQDTPPSPDLLTIAPPSRVATRSSDLMPSPYALPPRDTARLPTLRVTSPTTPSAAGAFAAFGTVGSLLGEPVPPIEAATTDEFRPRGRSLNDDARAAHVDEGASSSPGRGTIWQRLAEYRSQGRFRLLTLWETGSNSISLQTGKHGGPWLQWTSHLTSHAGSPSASASTRGLLDEFIPHPLSGASRAHLPTHSTPPAAGKNAQAGDAATEK